MKLIAKIVGLALSSGLALMGCLTDSNSSSGSSTKAVFKSAYKPITREYWITTEVINKWDMIPSGKATMSNDPVDSARRYLIKTIRYVQTDSQGNKFPQPAWQQLSGPIIRATVGDSVVVHFKNGSNTGMPLSMHPHNLFYDTLNEGVWRADMPASWPAGGTAGGSVNPGDSFTYHWAAREQSVGAGPYHSHSFHPADEISMGLIGTVIVDLPPDHPDYIKFDTTVALVFKTYLAMVYAKADTMNMDTTKKDTCVPPLIPWNGGCHPRDHVPPELWPENVVDTVDHGGGPEVHTINGIAEANLMGLNFKMGQKIRWVVFAMDDEGTQNHTIHFHGEMLHPVSNLTLNQDVFDLPSAVAQDLMMVADNPGKWMLHCHVEHHAMEMMAVYDISE